MRLPTKRNFINYSISAVTLTIVVAGLWYSHVFADSYKGNSVLDQFLYGLQWVFYGVVFLFVTQLAAMRAFDNPQSDDAPLSGSESPAWKVRNRVFLNNCEQATLWFPAFLYMATRLPVKCLALVPVFMTSWIFFRIVYWIGYSRGTGTSRCYGYAPSMYLLLIAIVLGFWQL